MSSSSRHKEKLVVRSEIHREDANEGTAARTRPISYDEIMLRRENKKYPTELAAKPVNSGNLSGEVSREDLVNRSQSGRSYRNTKLSSAVATKHSSEDVAKVNSRYYEDNMSKDRMMRNIEKDNRDRVIRSKPLMNRDFIDKEKRSIDDRRDQRSRRHDNRLNGKFGNEYERRHSGHIIERERYVDKSRGRPAKEFERKSRNDVEERKSEREIKRKHRNGDEERGRQQDAIKKHDSGERHDQEPAERKDTDKKERKESSQFHDEESRAKKMSPRSREPDTDKDRQASSQQNDVHMKDSGRIHDQEAPIKSDHERKERKQLLQSHDDKSRSKRKRSRSRELEKGKGRLSSPSKNDVHKHDYGKRHDHEASVKRDHERKERKESSQLHDEESKSKKKRSRSRERNMDKGRRQASLSPRSHRHREHGNGSSHSSKDRFRREQADDERNRKSSNGSSGRYRRSEGNSSGLGGYSPRKRKTEAGTKTPSPPHRSPEKKSAGWDLPPPGENTTSTASVLPNTLSLSHTVTSNTHAVPSMQPVMPTSLTVIRGVISYASVDSVQLTQATRPMRRLYVENIPDSASEKSVTECLNNFLLSSGVIRVPGSQPCISCTINKEKGQALVEFLTPEDASAALNFDGRSLSGSVLKIRRPKDYTEVATGAVDKSATTSDFSSNIVRDSPNKIFIGGISKLISSDMLRELVAVQGPLKSFHFITNGDLGGPCAFLEYVDESITLKACAVLNGMRLGGQMLTVVQATPNASSAENFGKPPFYGIPEHAKPLLQKPTQVLKLKNVLKPDELSTISKQELEETLEDVRLECARFGTVNSVHVVKYRDGDSVRETCSIPDVTVSADDKGTDVAENMKTEHHGEQIDGKSQETGVLAVSHQVPDATASADDTGLTSVENMKIEHLGDHIDVKSQETGILEVPHQVPDGVVSADNIGTISIKNSETEDGGELLDGHSQEIGILEVPHNNPKQNGKDDKSLEEKAVSHAASFVNSSDLDHQLLNKNGEKIDVNITTTESKADEIIKTEEVSLEAVSSPKINLAEAKKNENKESVSKIEDAFESGSILVEYKRVEAAAVAAHNLHGRLYDNKVVTVGYVDFDTYRSRFPK